VGDVRDSKGEDAKAMRGFDDQTSRLYQRVVGLRGMNSASPARSLPDGESPSLSGVLLSTGNIVPGKVGGDAAFTNPNPVWDEPIRLAFVGEFTLLTSSLWETQSAGCRHQERQLRRLRVRRLQLLHLPCGTVSRCFTMELP